MYVGETTYHYTYEAILILILYYVEPLQIHVVAQLWHDWDIFYNITQHHSPDWGPRNNNIYFVCLMDGLIAVFYFYSHSLCMICVHRPD